MAKKINVVIKRPGQAAEHEIINETLGNLQKLVDGPIETVRFADGVTMLVNELGKIRGLENNFYLWNDMIVGTAVFVGTEGEEFASCPMSAEKIEEICKMGVQHG